MKVSAGRQFETYEVSGQELRIHWNIVEKTRQEMDGSTVTFWEADEALCSRFDDRATLIEKIIGSQYSTGRELATINNQLTKPDEYAAYQTFRVQVKQLADGWFNRAG